MGEHLLLMALNRALQPTSKRGMERWFRSTALPRIVRGRASLSSQALWNHMDRVTPEAMRSIEVEVSKALRDRFQVEMDLLLYDPTNFSTYVQEHEGNELPQYGHAMSGRVDLRVVNLALLVARDGGLPLIHEAYRGNRHDAPQFRRSVDRLREWISLLDAEVEDLTLVFDKGNNSESNIGLLEGMRVGFVGSLRPSLHRDLLLIPLEEFTLAYRDGERETLSYRTTNEVFGARRTVVVAYNEELREAHMARLADMVEGRLRVLEEVEAGLNKGRLRTKKRVRERVQRRLKKPLLVRWKVRQRKGVLSLEYGPDPEAIEERSLGFGRTLLFTNRHGWSDGEIVRAYRERAVVERAFRRMNARHSISVTPMYHWTDQKIAVHLFSCVLALLLLCLLRRLLAHDGVEVSVGRLARELGEMRQAILIYPGRRPIRKLESMTPIQSRIHTLLDLEKYE